MALVTWEVKRVKTNTIFNDPVLITDEWEPFAVSADGFLYLKRRYRKDGQKETNS